MDEKEMDGAVEGAELDAQEPAMVVGEEGAANDDTMAAPEETEQAAA